MVEHATPPLRRNRIIGTVVGIAALAPVFYFLASAFADRLDLVNHSIFKFWLAGRMMATGLSPYDSEAWLRLHHEFGSKWLDNVTFFYPAALAYLLQPLGLMPIRTAFVTWGTGILLSIVASIFIVVGGWAVQNRALVAALIVLACGLYVPVFQTLANSQLAGFLLLLLCAASQVAGMENSFLRGTLVGLAVIKPALGVPICGVMGLWMLSRRDWPGVAGVVSAAGLIVAISFLHDLGWIAKFLAVSSGHMKDVAVNQPTMINASTALCSGNHGCGLSVTIVAWVLLFGRCVYLGFARGGSLDPLAAVSLAITWTLMATPYLWPYDYVLLILPFLWISDRLIQSDWSPVLVAMFWLAMVAIMFALTPDVAAGDMSYVPDIVVPLLTFIALNACLWMRAANTARSGEPATP